MRVLYVGQYSEGTTSKMRADTINNSLKPNAFEIIDSHIPFFKTTPFFRSLGFRYKIGPLITKTNNYIQEKLKSQDFDLIWVDKGVFITPKTTRLLKSKSSQLVHFTPDMAFYANQSSHFRKSINYYNYLITTKSKELDFYKQYVKEEKILLTTQGFDKNTHKPFYSFAEKDEFIVFIGLAEKSRLYVAEQIILSNLKLKIVGKGWESFVEKYKSNENLTFIGDSMFGEDYSKLISMSKFALGMLSKHFPELHTTRTFEIPACGTALLTEKNEETQSFFSDDEVIFYKDVKDLIKKINYFRLNQSELKNITEAGMQKVLASGYDYESLLTELLTSVIK